MPPRPPGLMIRWDTSGVSLAKHRRVHRRLLMAAVILVALVGVERAAFASAFSPSAASIVVRDRLGDDDEVLFYFAPGTYSNAVPRIYGAVKRLGIRWGGVSAYYTEDGRLIVYILKTTIGERLAPTERRVPSAIFSGLDIFGGEDVVFEPPSGADVSGTVARLDSDFSWDRYRVIQYSTVEYQSDAARIYASPIVLIAGALMLFFLARWWARRINRKSFEIPKKLHKLRVLAALGMIPVFFVSTAALGAGSADLGENLFGTLAPSLTRARVFIFVFGLGFNLATWTFPFFAFLRGWTPTYRRLRGIQQQAIPRRIKLLGTVVVPMLIWITVLTWFVNRFIPSGPAAIVVTFAGVIGFQAVFPLMLIRLVPTKTLDPDVRRRLLSITDRLNVHVRDIRVLESKGGKAANAFVIGLTKRTRLVLITDVLLAKFQGDEVDAVFAHELGHAKGSHLAIKFGVTIGLLSALTIAGDLLASRAPTGASALIAGLAPILMISGLFVIRGLVGIRLEERADDYAAATMGTDAMCRALDRLAEINATKRRTGLLWNMMTEHPGIDRRIERLHRQTPAKPTGPAWQWQV